MPETFDFVIVGAGIVGLTLARALRRRHPGASLTVLDKETDLGRHASGRNSGVVHAGLYYPPGTLKARFCVEGAAALRAYCEANGLPLARYGKLILPRLSPAHGAKDDGLDALFARATANGVRVALVDGQTARSLEPACAPVERALHSPDTACVDPKAILAQLVEGLGQSGVVLHLGSPVLGVDQAAREVLLPTGRLPYGTLINCAGAGADRLAHSLGVGRRYALVPFRGPYYELDPASGLDIRGNLYPVPDPDLPFLGVHFTRSVAGKVYVGPTALPALGREHYQGFTGIDWAALPGRALLLARQYARNESGFRRHVHAEARRLSKVRFLAEARGLVPGLEARHLLLSSKVGIRAQLYDRVRHGLEMDFVVEDGPSSLHVLNAVSPGLTCSLAFAEYLADRALGTRQEPLVPAR